MKEIKARDGIGRSVTIRVGDVVQTGITEPEPITHRVMAITPNRIICRTCRGQRCWKTEWTPDEFADLLVNPQTI